MSDDALRAQLEEVIGETLVPVEIQVDPPPPPDKFECKRCKARGPEKWDPPCPSCGFWASCGKIKGVDLDQKRTLATAADIKPVKRISTGIPGLDKIFGGDRDPAIGYGLRPGHMVLLAGPAGCGKSTISLQILDGVCTDKFKGVYAGGEMNSEDTNEFARRLGIKNPNITVLGNACDVYKWMEDVEEIEPKIMVVDSIQTMFMSDVEADVGILAQMNAVMNYLTDFGKRKKVIVIFLCHMTNAGTFAGGSTIRHLCDVCVRIDPRPTVDDEGKLIEDTKNVREMSIDEKNRFGPSDTTALLEMTEEGLKPLSKRKMKYYSDVLVE